MAKEFFAYKTPTDRGYESYLDIHNAGIETYDGTEQPLKTVRPNGRKDYLLLYACGGQLRIKETDWREFTARSHCVVYRPCEPQNYESAPVPDGKICWIHFNGVFAEEILREAGLCGKITCVRRNETIVRIFRQIVEALRETQPDCKLKCKLLFFKLTVALSDSGDKKSQRGLIQSKRDRKRIYPAIEYIGEHLDEHFTVDFLASVCALSKTTFIRTFSKATGTSPIAYVIGKKLESSLYYLLETDATVEEIADKFGFENQFYYSNLFKKKYGLSPSNYRKMQ